MEAISKNVSSIPKGSKWTSVAENQDVVVTCTTGPIVVFRRIGRTTIQTTTREDFLSTYIFLGN
jgi:hypothetical protein